MSALKRFIPATVAVLIFCSLSACSESGPNGPAAAKVNGSVITKTDVDRTVNGLLAKNGFKAPLAPDQMKKAADAALERLVYTELLYQEGKKLEIKDLDQMVEKEYQAKRSAFPSQAEYEKALQASGMSDKEVRDTMRKEIVVNNFVQEKFFVKAVASEADARKFYDQNREKLFQKGDRVRVSHILVATDPKTSADQKQLAKQKAELLLKRVQSGEDFAMVANKESSCPSKAVGGDLGVIDRGKTVPPFEQAAFALKGKGDLSRVVESQFGYHIIKLQEKMPAATERFEEAKENIIQHLKREQTRKAVDEYVAQLRSKAKIEK